MNKMRRILGYLMVAMLLGAFAAPAMADNKVYTLNMSPSSLSGGSSNAAVTATFANVSPTGNSTFKSIKLFAPSGVKITGVTVPSGFTATYSIQNSGGSVWIDSINLPVKPGGPVFALALKVDTTCTGGGSWTTVAGGVEQVWTGSGWTGSTFFITTPSSVTTSINACPTVTSSSSGNGTISPLGGQTVNFNAKPSFTLTPASGYHVDTVTGTCGGTLTGAGDVKTFTTNAITTSCTVIGNFAINTYAVTASSTGHGSISPASQTVNYNTTAAFTLAPDAGYHVGTVTSTCGGSLSGTTFTTNPVTAAGCSVSASFANDTYNLGTTGANPLTPFAGTSTNGVPLTLTFSSGAGGATSAVAPTITAPTGVTIRSVTSSAPGTLNDSGAIFLPNTAVGTPVTLSVDVTSSCTHSTGSWAVVVNGFVPSGSPPGFNIQGDCRLQAQAPSVAASGVPFNVLVTALDGSGAPIANFTGPVTFSVSSGAGTVSPTTPINCGGATACSVKLTLPAGSQASQTTLVASSSIGGAPLSTAVSPAVTVWPGVLDCGNPLDPTILNPGGLNEIYPPADPRKNLPVPGWAGDGSRGSFNKDGGPCALVDYSFTNNILVDNSVILRWTTNIQPNAAFKYSMNWQPEWADPATGLPTGGFTKVQWFDTAGNLTPKVPGRACIGGAQLPAPYGTLTALTSGPDQITIGAPFPTGTIAVPTSYPFPIFIGDGTVTERLLVTGLVGGNTYSVQRHQGGTAQSNPVIGSVLVMSNPLPLDGSGNQMQVCLADEGFVGVPASFCTATPPTSPPPACLVETTTVLDIGDGGVSRTP